MLFGVGNTSRCSFLTSKVTRTLDSGTRNFTECAAAFKRYAMQVGQNDIIWYFFMPITSIISLRAQVLLPENAKRKETYKKVPSLLVILTLSNSIFHFKNLGVPLKQISEEKNM